MSTTRDKISGFQIFALLARAVLGLNILNIASVATREVGHEGWITLVGAALVIMLFYVLLATLTLRFPQARPLGIFNRVWGRPLGYLITIISVIYAAFCSLVVAVFYIHSLHNWFLPSTPLWVTLATIHLLNWWISTKPVRAFVRYLEFFFLLLLLMYALTLPMLYNIEWLFFQPLLSQPLSQVLLPIPSFVFAFLGMEVVIYFAPYYQQGRQVKSRKIIAIGIGVAVFSLAINLLATIGPLGVLGPEYSKETLYAISDALRVAQIPVIERLDFTFIFFWNFALMTSTSVFYYVASLGTKQILHIPPKYASYVGGMWAIVLFSLTQTVKTFEDVLILIDVVNNVFLIYYGLLMMTLVVSLVRKVKGDELNG